MNDDGARPRAAVSREATSWLLWRHDLKEFFRPLSTVEEHALVAARSGDPFGDVCAALCEHMPEDDAPVRAAEFLRGWIESGSLQRCRRAFEAVVPEALNRRAGECPRRFHS